MICFLLVFLICSTQVLTAGIAQNQEPSKKETSAFERIPDPNVDAIRRMARTEWPNPIIVVNADSYSLVLYIDGERVQKEYNLTDLEKALKQLRLERWRLGRVVALMGASLRSPGDNEKISEKCKEAKQMLESHKVMIELWPA